jgi:hypothetical protein
MSTTSIYTLGSEPGEIGECRNSWRGAMYVWNDIAKRYCGMPGFGFDEKLHNKVWNANRNYPMPEHEAIVLMSTMDNAIVWGRDANTVADAFEKYGREHPESSLTEQAEILRTAELKPDDALAWQQTSVGEFWGQSWDDEKDEPVWYNPATGTKHFDVLETAREKPRT